jgi:hypothetical protein
MFAIKLEYPLCRSSGSETDLMEKPLFFIYSAGNYRFSAIDSEFP